MSVNFVVIYSSLSYSFGVSPPSAENNASPGIDLKVSNLPCSTVWASKNKQWSFHLNSWFSLPSLNSWGLSLCLEAVKRREENGLALMERQTAQLVEWGLLNVFIIPSLILEALSLGRQEVTVLHSLITDASVGNMMARESLLWLWEGKRVTEHSCQMLLCFLWVFHLCKESSKLLRRMIWRGG